MRVRSVGGMCLKRTAFSEEAGTGVVTAVAAGGVGGEGGKHAERFLLGV